MNEYNALIYRDVEKHERVDLGQLVSRV